MRGHERNRTAADLSDGVQQRVVVLLFSWQRADSIALIGVWSSTLTLASDSPRPVVAKAAVTMTRAAALGWRHWRRGFRSIGAINANS